MKALKNLPFVLPLAFAGALVVTACNNAPKDSKEVAEDENKENLDRDMKKDAEFAVFAAEASMFEVKLGELAQTNASSPEVKQFGRDMIKDHGMANDELMSVAQTKGITLPTSLSEEKQEKYDEMAGKTGLDFDKAYMEKMVDGHKKVINKFEKEAENGEDPDLKTWAGNKLTALHHHLSMAEELHESLKNKK